MYNYIQPFEKDAWVPVKSKELEAKIKELNAKRVTILEVSELVEDSDRDRRTYSYKGPLYFDIDCKEDLKLAIESGKSLADKLIELGVPKLGVKLFASGSKGMHVTVDQKYFSSGRPIKALPLIYKMMAKELYVPGMDFQVYSCGKGNAFRVANVQREDGNYRVPLLYEELETIDAKRYQELTKEPRNIDLLEPNPTKVVLLQNMYEECRKELNTEKQPTLIVSSSETLAQIRDEVPPCIQNACDWKGVRAERSINQVAMQLGIYVGRTGVNSVVADGLISRLADSSKSSKYDSLRARYEHVRGQVSFMKHSESYQFSCASMRSLFTKSPCRGCPIEDSPEAANNASAMMGLVEREDGMFIVTKNGDKPLTNYTMTPTDHYIEIPRNGGAGIRVGTRIELADKSHMVASVVFNESSWLSRSAFMRDTTEGHGVLMFFGSDNDVQAIKGLVLNKENNMGEIYRVHTCGVYVETLGESEVYTYIEPDMSINSNKVQNTHEFAGDIVARPYFSECSICKKGNSEADEAMYNLLNINHPQEVALLMGWFAACHLKAHISALYNQFPVLSVWGSAGSGKSVTISLMSWINGTDYTMRDTPVNVSNITPFALLEYASSTTTVPRILEEYNKSKMRSASWKGVGEMLKAAWNSETVLRGGLAEKNSNSRTGGTVNKIPITSPLLVVSEQELEMPALQERSIRVKLSKGRRKGKQKNLRAANKGRKHLRTIGKALMATTLQTNSDQVDDWFQSTEEFLSEDLEDRPRYSLQVAMVGLKFLESVLTELELPKSIGMVGDLVTEMESYFEKISEHVDEINAQSEIDSVLGEMNIMAGLSKGSNPTERLMAGEQYIVVKNDEGNRLIVDPLMCHALYKKFAKQGSHTGAVIENTKSFLHLITEEPYFIESKIISAMNAERPMIVLDRAKM